MAIARCIRSVPPKRGRWFAGHARVAVCCAGGHAFKQAEHCLRRRRQCLPLPSEPVTHLSIAAAAHNSDAAVARSPASPAAHYGAEELEVFSAAEARVNEIFIQSGWHADRLGNLSALTEAHRPDPPGDAPAQQLATSERRAHLASRAVGVRRAEAWADLYERQAESAALAHHDAAALRRALEHDRKVLGELKTELGETERDASELANQLTAATQELGLARRYIGDMQASASWRVTFPLRVVAGQLVRLFAGIKTLIPTGAGIGRTLVAVSSRFPTLSRQLSRLLSYTPALRQWVVKWLDLPPAGPIKKSDLNPRDLSARGKALYNELARDLGMSELDETMPAGVREQAGNGK